MSIYVLVATGPQSQRRMPKKPSVKNQIRGVRRFLAKRGDTLTCGGGREQEKS